MSDACSMLSPDGVFIAIQTTAVTFIIFFLVGIGVSLRPAAVISGAHIENLLGNPVQRRSAYAVISVVILLTDAVLMHYIERLYSAGYPLKVSIDWLFTPLCLTLIAAVCAVILVQEVGIIDISHAERNLQFRFLRLNRHLIPPSREESYVQTHAGSLTACIVSSFYMLRMPIRSIWPYLLWALGCKALIIILNIVLLPMLYISAPLLPIDIDTLKALVLGDPYVVSYFIMGYLFGHNLFHHGRHLERIKAGSYHIWPVLARMILILSILLFLGVIMYLTASREFTNHTVFDTIIYIKFRNI